MNNKNKDNLWLIGPCSIESRDLYIETGKKLNEIMQGKNWFYKASFDKANRSAVTGKRGPGLEESLKMFKEIKKIIPGIKLITDVHEIYQVEKLAPYIDCIQIPAFLCRQTDLLVECGKHFNFVNIKKGQWMNPQNMVHSVGKVKSQNEDAEVWITERGTAFGYERLTIDFGSVPMLKKHFDRVILDCTHSTQYIENGFTVGNRRLAERYLLCAPIFGYNGVFAEVHPSPREAVSDGMCMIYLDRIKKIIESFDEISQAYKNNEAFLKSALN